MNILIANTKILEQFDEKKKQLIANYNYRSSTTTVTKRNNTRASILQGDKKKNTKSILQEDKKTTSEGKKSNKDTHNESINLSDLEISDTTSDELEKIEYEKQFYLMEAAPILTRYKQLLEKPIQIDFMGRKKKLDNQTISDKNKAISEYIEIAKRYTNLDIEDLLRRQSYGKDKKETGSKAANSNSRSNSKVGTFDQSLSPIDEILLDTTKKDKELVCESCNKKVFDIIDGYINVCVNCGEQHRQSVCTSSYKDSERINMSIKYQYEKKQHFKDCISQFQCKQNSTINKKVYDDLEREFEAHGLLIGDKNTDRKVRYSNITKKHVMMFLKETGNSKHYEDHLLIYCNISGAKPHDISYLEDKLLADFDTLVKLYNKKFKQSGRIERSSFINTQIVFFQLLRKHKYPCEEEDFSMLKTLDRLLIHDNIISELFAELGWNCVNLF